MQMRAPGLTRPCTDDDQRWASRVGFVIARRVNKSVVVSGHFNCGRLLHSLGRSVRGRLVSCMRSTQEFEVPVDVSFVPFSPSEHILGTGLDIRLWGLLFWKAFLTFLARRWGA